MRAMSKNPRPSPPTYEISANYFSAVNEHLDDADFPGRKYWYREEVSETGFPECVEVEPQFQSKKIRPIGTTILTCRRDVNCFIRGSYEYILPGKYHVIWLIWFTGGQNCFKSYEKPLTSFVPALPQKNLVSERYFLSTVESEGPPKLDSGFLYPWNFRFSAGRAQNFSEFYKIDIEVWANPLHAPLLLMPGYEEIVVDMGYWNTLKNIGWCELPGKTVEVVNDGTVAFVVGRKWTQVWTSGFSFGGVKLVPVDSK